MRNRVAWRQLTQTSGPLHSLVSGSKAALAMGAKLAPLGYVAIIGTSFSIACLFTTVLAGQLTLTLQKIAGTH
jgi:hypothetical protein